MSKSSMKFDRYLSSGDIDIYKQVNWKKTDTKITDVGGKVIFEMKDVEAPSSWSDTAIQILAQKYFRMAGVPYYTSYVNDEKFLDWLSPSIPASGTGFGHEKSAHQVFHRMAGCWAYHGYMMGIIEDLEQARIFYDEIYLMIALQIGAPNSPQWFNTGLWWAYGITGPDSGQWVFDSNGDVCRTPNSYEYPQVAACFIQGVRDDLVNEGGIMDLWVKEARLFKHGSGSGVNYSPIRGKGEGLSGGGISSGVMSFLEIGDAAAGSIKSGGIKRRAARMVILDADHPDIEDFIGWKSREEYKAAAMYVGSKIIADWAEKPSTYMEDLIPKAIIDRIANGFKPHVIDLKMEGEAYSTVGGQNANNSVRIENKFFDAIDNNEIWKLTPRTDRGSLIAKNVSAGYLWDEICKAAWESADPGLQFHNTINEWHTCKADGNIVGSNPCSEYLFLNETACNLASLNLCRFQNEDGTFDVFQFSHTVRLWTTVLEISVEMGSYPSREIAEGSYNYRTLGLGYANLGGLLMSSGIPYDSNKGRGFASAITALLTAVAYKTSAELADVLGDFPRYEANQNHMSRVLCNHARAIGVYTNPVYDGLSIEPRNYWQYCEDKELVDEAQHAWQSVIRAKGFRNAQVSVIAPTGTISFIMDCDTTGIEPEFSLVKTKTLSGGGQFDLVNEAIPNALFELGYDEQDVENICEWMKGKNKNIYGCPSLRPEHHDVFDTAVPPFGSERCIRPEAHIEMMAAVQPFVSGGISKTVNVPSKATVEHIAMIYRMAHEYMLKSVSVYRNGCKLSQPLNVVSDSHEKVPEPVVTSERRIDSKYNSTRTNITSIDQLRDVIKNEKFYVGSLTPSNGGELPRGTRENPPSRRQGGFTQNVKIGEHEIYLTINPFPDGRPCELFIELAKEGSMMRAFGNMVAMSMSMGLQYGVPVEQYVNMLRNLRFEPAGIVTGHDRIKMVSSIADYIARELGITFLGMDDMGQIVPAVSVDAGDKIVALDRRALEIAQSGFSGYTGDVCPECHNATMRPCGTCLRCDSCGATTGCS